MKRLFFASKDDENCWNEKYFQEMMRVQKLSEIEVYKAEPMKEKGIFWCNKHQICVIDGSAYTCGKHNCNEYQPRNGKSGRCKFHSPTLYTHGDKIILKFDILKVMTRKDIITKVIENVRKSNIINIL